MKKIFKEFLKSHNAYNSYIIELACNEYRPNTFDDFIIFVHHDELITMGFDWRHSKEGYDFWKELGLLWAKRLEELI